METLKQVKRAGEPTDTLPEYFAKAAWTNVPVLQARPFPAFYKRMKDEIESVDRCEFIAMQDDQVIGAMVFSYDDDIHVGPCLYVLLAYSGDPNALTRGYRWLMQCAKHKNIPWIITTQLIDNTNYSLKYRRVK